MAGQIDGDQPEAVAQLLNEPVPDAHIETPPVQQHQIGTRTIDLYVQIAHRIACVALSTRCLAQMRLKASTSASTCDSLCAADSATRSLELPWGTVGGLIATTQKPDESNSCCAFRAASA